MFELGKFDPKFNSEWGYKWARNSCGALKDSVSITREQAIEGVSLRFEVPNYSPKQKEALFNTVVNNGCAWLAPKFQ